MWRRNFRFPTCHESCVRDVGTVNHCVIIKTNYKFIQSNAIRRVLGCDKHEKMSYQRYQTFKHQSSTDVIYLFYNVSCYSWVNTQNLYTTTAPPPKYRETWKFVVIAHTLDLWWMEIGMKYVAVHWSTMGVLRILSSKEFKTAHCNWKRWLRWVFLTGA